MELTLGERIRKARKGNMTQAELAERVGVHEGTIRRWELGERIPDIIDLQKISQVLGVPINDLLDEAPAKPSDEISPIMGEDKSDANNLVYEWGGGHKLRLPNTPETRKLFQEIVMRSMSVTPAMA